MNSVIVNRFLCRLFDGRMRSETEVILRREVAPTKTAAGVIFRGTGGLRRLIRGLGIRPIAIAPPEILPGVELLHALEEIRAVRVAILAQAPRQPVQSHNIVHALTHPRPHHRPRGRSYCLLTTEKSDCGNAT